VRDRGGMPRPPATTCSSVGAHPVRDTETGNAVATGCRPQGGLLQRPAGVRDGVGAHPVRDRGTRMSRQLAVAHRVGSYKGHRRPRSCRSAPCARPRGTKYRGVWLSPTGGAPTTTCGAGPRSCRSAPCARPANRNAAAAGCRPQGGLLQRPAGVRDLVGAHPVRDRRTGMPRCPAVAHRVGSYKGPQASAIL
jgi:hypothetical protein